MRNISSGARRATALAACQSTGSTANDRVDLPWRQSTGDPVCLTRVHDGTISGLGLGDRAGAQPERRHDRQVRPSPWMLLLKTLSSAAAGGNAGPVWEGGQKLFPTP